MQLADFKVLTFDCYGTLIDWESGILKGLEPLTDRIEIGLSEDALLEAHARHESAQQSQTPAMYYHDILAIVYKRLAEEWGVAVSWDDCVTYGLSVQNWPAFPDSADALKYLKEHYKLVILSNVDNRSFAASREKLGIQFDAIYTAQDIGNYKPADVNFEYMLRNLATLGVDKMDILHTAESLFHDHKPANRYGLSSCWIYRRHAKEGFGATMHPGEMPQVAFRFNSMANMVAAHQAR
ncbi:haloacid dehalogenase type II [Chloroflexi bacterium TSY]|nr:haloacid dehalogenase type II [Chloroflexi bacterium TSY]